MADAAPVRPMLEYRWSALHIGIEMLWIAVLQAAIFLQVSQILVNSKFAFKYLVMEDMVSRVGSCRLGLHWHGAVDMLILILNTCVGIISPIRNCKCAL